MGYEIDFLAVGEKKSGDAICIRWGNLHGSRDEQKVVVIDAGYASTGEQVIEHIEKYYRTKTIDLLISTHPDGDHVGGLTSVLENAEVKEFWIHKPWEHNQGLASEFADGRITDASIANRMKENLQKAYDAVKLAEKKGIEIKEPFQGMTWDNATLVVIGPTQSYYETLIPDFARMPKKAEDTAGFEVLKAVFESVVEKTKKFIDYVAEWFTDEGINNDDTTSAQNNSSVILKLEIDGRTLVFTGDAGITALDQASQYINKESLRFIQVPHHGSRRNVGPDVLDKLVGNIVNEGEKREITAFVSCAPGSDKHPHQAVINAFTRRGAKVIATEGLGKYHFYNAPERAGWKTATPRSYISNYRTEE
ncbi:MBL fold hydrolase [Escherichia coli]|uniref:ComEC/Rec2 family competence protein n=1 Tax=Escherichia coli TaxID=562 RepID=UPI000A2D60D8|nr:MBL fold metallo-hydrolase [Escherichia coli]EFK1738189.1 MBL fold metallo-hydrolase [Escherichia coli]EFN5820453.1 MBL fold metallo-hydrolase [Escherichia coli]EHY7527117.1 MBL fold metallo-hydrolase [Escherichia coli]EJB4120008.1 MBL fold metallo-hydrolase [Escherichia coli]OTD31857.1 MBL fold hydrolase [Escherichia coli]